MILQLIIVTTRLQVTTRLLQDLSEFSVISTLLVQISKRVFQENKACQIFRKTNISYPLIRTNVVRNICFSQICHALFSWNNRFEIRTFALLLTTCPFIMTPSIKYTNIFTKSCLFPISIFSRPKIRPSNALKSLSHWLKKQ